MCPQSWLYWRFQCLGELGRVIGEQLIKSQYSANLVLLVIASALANLSDVGQKIERVSPEIMNAAN